MMFPSSLRPQDRAAAERLGAGFVTKPARWADYLTFARQLQQCLDSRGPCVGDTAG